MPTDDEILEANRALARLSQKFSTAVYIGAAVGEGWQDDVALVRRGLGIAYEGAAATPPRPPPRVFTTAPNGDVREIGEGDAGDWVLDGPPREPDLPRDLHGMLAAHHRIGRILATVRADFLAGVRRAGNLEPDELHEVRGEARAILRHVGAGDDETLRLIATVDAIDMGIADLAGAVREVGRILAHARRAYWVDGTVDVAAIPDERFEAGKAQQSKRASRTRKRK